jgi:hypothetical protein
VTVNKFRRRPEAKGYLKVLEVLREWDPISVLPYQNEQDEYDCLAAGITRFLDAGAQVGELARHMADHVRDHMGFTPAAARTEECAAKLVAFWKEWDRSGRGREKSG